MKVKNTSLILLLLLVTNCIILTNYFSGAYDTYTSVEEAKKNRDRAYFLKLDNQNLFNIPDDVRHLTTLRNLSVKNNYIKKLPLALCDIYNSLQWLYLDNNNFDKVANLPCLTVGHKTYVSLSLMSMRYNQIEFIGKDFKHIGAGHLDLSYNSIKEVDEELEWPEHMGILNLSHNRIKTLPKTFKRNSIYWLNLSHNQLTTLPDRFGVDEEIKDESGQVIRRYRNYKRLLDVSYNKIKKIPDAFLKNNKKIKKLILTGNPLSEAEVEKVRRALPPDTEVVF